MVVSTSYTPGTTFKSAELNEIVFTLWNHKSRHQSGGADSLSTTFAPFSGSTVYITGATSDLGTGTSTSYYPFSTEVYSESTHLHNLIYAPISGSTVYISGTSTDIPTSTSFYPYSTSVYAEASALPTTTSFYPFSTEVYSESTHLHALIYAPITGSTVYITGTTTDLGGGVGTSTSYYPFSTELYSVTSHLHDLVYAPLTGSTVYISGTTTDIPTSTSFYPYSTDAFAASSDLPGVTSFYPYSTSVYSESTHLHTGTYAPASGSTVYITGTTTDLGAVGTSTSYFPFSTDVYSVSTHLHTGTYAPAFSTADYMPAFSTADYSPAGHGHSSTGTYSTEGHVHALATTAANGFLVALGGATSQFLSSTGGWMDPPTGTVGTSTSYYPFSTDLFSVTTHDHALVYAPITGSTVYITGTTTDLGGVGTSTSYFPFSTDVYSVSTHLHDLVYAPLFSTSDYAPMGQAASSDHLHTGVYVTGSSTQFTLWGSSTNYAPIIGSTVYLTGTSTQYVPGTSTGYLTGSSTDYLTGSSTDFAPYIHGFDSTVYHSTQLDNTLFNASTLHHGLLPKLGGFSSKFFTDAGTMLEVSTAIYSTQGHAHGVATTSAAGFLPTLLSATSQFLTSTGGWADPPAGSTAAGGGAQTDTAANLAAVVLDDGELGWATDTHVLKVGDGVTAFSSLPFAISGGYELITDIEMNEDNSMAGPSFTVDQDCALTGSTST